MFFSFSLSILTQILYVFFLVPLYFNTDSLCFFPSPSTILSQILYGSLNFSLSILNRDSLCFFHSPCLF